MTFGSESISVNGFRSKEHKHLPELMQHDRSSKPHTNSRPLFSNYPEPRWANKKGGGVSSVEKEGGHYLIAMCSNPHTSPTSCNAGIIHNSGHTWILDCGIYGFGFTVYAAIRSATHKARCCGSAPSGKSSLSKTTPLIRPGISWKTEATAPRASGGK